LIDTKFTDERRQFCKKLAYCGILASNLTLISACGSYNTSLYASAFTDLSGNHFVGWFDQTVTLKGHVSLPNRAHDLFYNQHNETLLVFSRRPGNVMFIIDIKSQKIINTVLAEKNHHFYGHGVISLDGRYLFTSENRFDPQFTPYEGEIVVRNTHDFKVETIFKSGGIGPHQIALLNNGNSIAVANGGIHTHPDRPRSKLNLDTMSSNLSYINAKSGKVIGTFTPPNKQLSIRHLCVFKDRKVFAGCQYQGPKHEPHPLIFAHDLASGQQQLASLQTDLKDWLNFKQYTASLAMSGKEDVLAVTSPRGGIISFWDARSEKLICIEKHRDCAGIAEKGQHFIASTGRGELLSTKNEISLLDRYPFQWDNHMIRIT
jgi:hypothetical protein